jgi:ankyrin repeat protein
MTSIEEDKHEKLYHLKAILNDDPIDWQIFLDLDYDLDVFSHPSCQCSFLWILKHFPPDNVVQTLLNRHHEKLFSNTLDMKQILDGAVILGSTVVVDYICRHFPTILNERMDENGNTALHRTRKSDIASIIVSTNPALLGIPNRNMNLPLHEAIIHFCSPEHVQLLVEQGREYLTRCNEYGETALSILLLQVKNGVDIINLSLPFCRTDKFLWEKLNILIEAQFEPEPGGEFNILHRLIQLKSPAAAIHMAVLMEPHQVQKTDINGNFPISLLAENYEYRKRTIDTLIDLFPDAASIPNSNGEFALHLCAKSGRLYNDGIDSVFNANPSASTMSDFNGIAPFMDAASNTTSVDAIYRLLLQCPNNV